MADVLLRGGRPWGHDCAADIFVRDGAIAAIGADLDGAGADVLEISDRLVLPGLVDALTSIPRSASRGSRRCARQWRGWTGGSPSSRSRSRSTGF
jgi:cytosine/adenosine deaminase-related metal-dependent hydrolase